MRRNKEHFPKVRIHGAEDIAKLCASMTRHQVEVARVVVVQGGGLLVGWKTLSRLGSNHRAIMLPGDVFRPPILWGRRHIYLVHNHPHEDVPVPSPSDIRTTRELIYAGKKFLDIAILDHVIIGQREFASLKELGHLENLDAEFSPSQP